MSAEIRSNVYLDLFGAGGTPRRYFCGRMASSREAYRGTPCTIVGYVGTPIGSFNYVWTGRTVVSTAGRRKETKRTTRRRL